jgi:class 3 adenylate cyclase
MSKLDSRKRASLPDSAFAYIDSRGRRRLPINDEAHVRNALARFNQVSFEDDAARERARTRLLNAAKKYGILPIRFITRQLEAERRHAAAGEKRTAAPAFPTGFVTLLMTDIEGSTGLLHQLGDRYGELLNEVRGLLRSEVLRAGGCEIDARADEYFAVFENAAHAVGGATAIQRVMSERTWPENLEVRVRAGIHSGNLSLTNVGYIGMAVHAAARVCSAAHGGQIVISGDTRAAIQESTPTGIRMRDLGEHQLHGLKTPLSLYQIEAEGLRTDFPPPYTGGRSSRSS